MSKMHHGASNLIFQRARELRDTQTHAEVILWGYLKTKPLGYKFRRQHPYGLFILDFYSHSAKLVIEVDGPIHDKEYRIKYDIERQKSIEKDGLRVIRFTNNSVEMNLPDVINSIETLLKKLVNE